jgi:Cu/Ag efflux protein CusF
MNLSGRAWKKELKPLISTKGGEAIMRNELIVLVGLILVFFLSGLTTAQEKTKSAGVRKPEGTKQEIVKKEPPARPVEYRIGGIIKDISPATRKITIKQSQVKKERIFTYTMGKETAKELSNLKVGDAVNIWVKGKEVTILRQVS